MPEYSFSGETLMSFACGSYGSALDHRAGDGDAIRVWYQGFARDPDFAAKVGRSIFPYGTRVSEKL
jgi:hypothetical protein